MKGGHYKGHDVGTPSAQIDSKLIEVNRVWSNSDKAAEIILKLQKELTSFGVTLQKLNGISPNLLDLSEEISTLKTQTGATPPEIAASSQLVMLTQRLGRSANEFLTSEGVNPETALWLGKDTNTFRDIVSGFLNSSDVLCLSASKSDEERSKLMELEKSFVGIPGIGRIDSGQYVELRLGQAIRSADFYRELNPEAALERSAGYLSRCTGYAKHLVLADAAGGAGDSAGIARVQVQDSRRRTLEAEVRRM